MSEGLILLFSITALMAGGLIVWLGIQYVSLKDENARIRENSVSLERIPSEFIPAAKDECFRQIEIFKCKH